VNGGEGYAVIDPDPATITEFERKRRAATAERATLEEFKYLEARTRDGRRVEVLANLGSASEAEDALSWGAEGAGLLRTEFLFMEREELPSEDEQYEAYRRVARAFGEKPVIIRTLDVGGDKNLPGVDQPEENHNGGQLAFGPDGYIRYGLDDPMAALASRTAGSLDWASRSSRSRPATAPPPTASGARSTSRPSIRSPFPSPPSTPMPPFAAGFRPLPKPSGRTEPSGRIEKDPSP